MENAAVNEDELLPAIEVQPEGEPTGSVIWLHGLGATGHDFLPILPMLPLAQLGVRVVLPHAPKLPVTINAGFVMPAWYDIRNLQGTEQDEEGIRRSAAQLERWVDAETRKGIPSERIALVGFSQGGAIALHTGLRLPVRLAGIAGLSTYLVLDETVADEASQANRGVPIFQAHGRHDPLVTLPRGQQTRARLEELGYDVEWHDYPMEHQVCDQEISDLAAWFEQVFGTI